MKKEILTEKSISVLLIIGSLVHVFGYYLEELTIRNESVMWLSIAITSIPGSIFLVWKLKLLGDQSYSKKIKRLRLQLLKGLVCILMYFGSVIAFGGYLNLFVLGSNFLVTSHEEIKSFNILEVISSKPGLSKRTSRRVPLIRFTDGKFFDEVKLNEVDIEDINVDASRLKIAYKKGMWGLGVIKNIEVY